MIDWEKLAFQNRRSESDTDVLLMERPAPRYTVVVYNDDYTPMEFVVNALRAVFGLDEEEATRLTMQVHYDGKSNCGIYSKQSAIDRAQDMMALARSEGHPLLCVAEQLPGEDI